jgi:hypothetical protein
MSSFSSPFTSGPADASEGSSTPVGCLNSGRGSILSILLLNASLLSASFTNAAADAAGSADANGLVDVLLPTLPPVPLALLALLLPPNPAPKDAKPESDAGFFSSPSVFACSLAPPPRRAEVALPDVRPLFAAALKVKLVGLPDDKDDEDDDDDDEPKPPKPPDFRSGLLNAPPLPPVPLSLLSAHRLLGAAEPLDEKAPKPLLEPPATAAPWPKLPKPPVLPKPLKGTGGAAAGSASASTFKRFEGASASASPSTSLFSVSASAIVRKPHTTSPHLDLGFRSEKKIRKVKDTNF